MRFLEMQKKKHVSVRDSDSSLRRSRSQPSLQDMVRMPEAHFLIITSSQNNKGEWMFAATSCTKDILPEISRKLDQQVQAFPDRVKYEIRYVPPIFGSEVARIIETAKSQSDFVPAIDKTIPSIWVNERESLTVTEFGRMRHSRKDLLHRLNPIFLMVESGEDAARLGAICKKNNIVFPYDFSKEGDSDIIPFRAAVAEMLEEIIGEKFSVSTAEKYRKVIEKLRLDTDMYTFGHYVYLPFDGRVVHILPNTNGWFYKTLMKRNPEKITPKEQVILRDAPIAVIGQSVGQVITRDLVYLGCSDITIADWKEFKTSNLSRVGVPLTAVGSHKVEELIKTAMRYNPYANITAYFEGLRSYNVEKVLAGKRVVVDEVDDPYSKALLHEYCRKNRIRVVMGFDELNTVQVIPYDQYDLKKPDAVPEFFRAIDPDEYRGAPSIVLLKFLDVELSERQKETVKKVGKGLRFGFSQTKYETSFLAGVITSYLRWFLTGEADELYGTFSFGEDVIRARFETTERLTGLCIQMETRAGMLVRALKESQQACLRLALENEALKKGSVDATLDESEEEDAE